MPRTMGAVQFLLALELLFLVVSLPHNVAVVARPLDCAPLDIEHGTLEESTETAMGGMLRESFPPNFLFGTGSSAFQYEGAASEGGRGPCIWDAHTHIPGAVADNTTADVAVDQYHRYKEDVQLMKDLNMDVYRMSISWSRIFPDGVGPEPNWEGVAYYNALIDELLTQGIQPFVTLLHWDMPQALNDSIGGWLSRDIIQHFARYADFCFAQFGDRVKHWMTLNEGYIQVAFRLDSAWNGSKLIWPSSRYIEGHNIILSHATAAKIYHNKYQKEQGGMLGVSFLATLFWPLSDSAEDIAAAERAMLFEMGWMMDAMIFGDYPELMKQYLGVKLPEFTEEERQLLRGSLDFVGLNHYTTWYASQTLETDTDDGFFPAILDAAADVRLAYAKDGVLIGTPDPATFWNYNVPWGLQSILNWVKTRYNNPVMFLTEHGVSYLGDSPTALKESLQDDYRISVHREYLKYALAAIKEGCDVRGYIMWSLLDNFEFKGGFTKRFGLYYVDITDGLKRHPRASARWFKRLLQRRPHDHNISGFQSTGGPAEDPTLETQSAVGVGC